jgi:hypothetical protein
MAPRAPSLTQPPTRHKFGIVRAVPGSKSCLASNPANVVRNVSASKTAGVDANAQL